MSSRLYTSRRKAIVSALVEKIKQIDGQDPYQINLWDNVSPYLEFWDEINQFPAVHLNAGAETREYQGGGYKDRFMNLTIRCYVRQDSAIDALEALIEDVETILEDNSRLEYEDRQENIQKIQQITVNSIDTDEGVLEPLGVAEIMCEIRY